MKRIFLVTITSIIAFIFYFIIFIEMSYGINKENNTENNIIENEISEEILNVDASQNTTEVEEEVEPVKYTAPTGETYSIIGTVSIPTLGINYSILQGETGTTQETEALLKIAPTKYWGPNPNKVGNMVVIGHNYKTTKFFSKLPNIKIGDIIQITDLKEKTLNYTVYDTQIIDPYDNSCTSQLTEGHTEITLITCYNDGATRFVVKARAD